MQQKQKQNLKQVSIHVQNTLIIAQMTIRYLRNAMQIRPLKFNRVCQTPYYIYVLTMDWLLLMWCLRLHDKWANSTTPALRMAAEKSGGLWRFKRVGITFRLLLVRKRASLEALAAVRQGESDALFLNDLDTFFTKQKWDGQIILINCTVTVTITLVGC